MTTDRGARVEAARAVLITHDELLHVETGGDAFVLGPDDLPIDGHGWLAWHGQQYKPAYAAWKTAMQRLEAVLGSYEFPGTHPHNFRPACRRILARAGVPLHETTTSIGGAR
jgi:hypothetical protein